MIACRYSKAFTTIEPTVYNVCDYWFNKDQSRIRDIRPDALAQILTLANIQPGGKYLAVDDASGLVVAGILERMGGRKWSLINASFDLFAQVLDRCSLYVTRIHPQHIL